MEALILTISDAVAAPLTLYWLRALGHAQWIRETLGTTHILSGSGEL